MAEVVVTFCDVCRRELSSLDLEGAKRAVRGLEAFRDPVGGDPVAWAEAGAVFYMVEREPQARGQLCPTCHERLEELLSRALQEWWRERKAQGLEIHQEPSRALSSRREP